MECDLRVDDPRQARTDRLLRAATWVGAAAVAAGAAAYSWPAGLIVAGAATWKIAGTTLVTREARLKAARDRAEAEARKAAGAARTATVPSKPAPRPATATPQG